MVEIDITNSMKYVKLRSQIKERIFEDIRNRKLFGFRCLWQFYMVIDFCRKFPKNLLDQVDLAIKELVEENIFEENNFGYKLTTKGEDLVYENELYSVDSVIQNTLIYFRDHQYFENVRWPFLTAMSYSEKLVVYEQRLFKDALNKMIDDGLLQIDEPHNAYVVTKKCQDLIFGLK